MPSSALQPLFNLQLANAAAALYTAPAGFWVQITKLLAVNVDGSSHQVTLALLPQGNSYSAVFITTDALSLLSGATYGGYNEYGLVLAPGDQLWGFADAAAHVNCFASGLLISGS